MCHFGVFYNLLKLSVNVAYWWLMAELLMNFVIVLLVVDAKYHQSCIQPPGDRRRSCSCMLLIPKFERTSRPGLL